MPSLPILKQEKDWKQWWNNVIAYFEALELEKFVTEDIPHRQKLKSAGCALKRTDLLEQVNQGERRPPFPCSLKHAVSKFQRSEHLEHSTVNFERLSFLTCSMRFLRLKLYEY